MGESSGDEQLGFVPGIKLNAVPLTVSGGILPDIQCNVKYLSFDDPYQLCLVMGTELVMKSAYDSFRRP